MMWEMFVNICINKKSIKTELTKATNSQESWLPMIKLQWPNWRLPTVAIFEYFQRVKLYLTVCMVKPGKGKGETFETGGEARKARVGRPFYNN
jgi:hypothetical protein